MKKNDHEKDQPTPLEKLDAKARAFLSPVMVFISCRNFLRPSHIQLDHLGYSCSSKEEYEMLKAEYEKRSLIINESIIGGRRILYCAISHLLDVGRGYNKIEHIEICEPKPQGNWVNGFDHIELYPIKEEDFSSVGAHLQSHDAAVAEVLGNHVVFYVGTFELKDLKFEVRLRRRHLNKVIADEQLG